MSMTDYQFRAMIAQDWRKKHNLPRLSNKAAIARHFNQPPYDGWWKSKYVGVDEAMRLYAEENKPK